MNILIEKGDNCIVELILGGPKTAACDAGLVCDRTTHTCVDKQ